MTVYAEQAGASGLWDASPVTPSHAEQHHSAAVQSPPARDPGRAGSHKAANLEYAQHHAEDLGSETPPDLKADASRASSSAFDLEMRHLAAGLLPFIDHLRVANGRIPHLRTEAAKAMKNDPAAARDIDANRQAILTEASKGVVNAAEGAANKIFALADKARKRVSYDGEAFGNIYIRSMFRALKNQVRMLGLPELAGVQGAESTIDEALTSLGWRPANYYLAGEEFDQMREIHRAQEEAENGNGSLGVAARHLNAVMAQEDHVTDLLDQPRRRHAAVGPALDAIALHFELAQGVLSDRGSWAGNTRLREQTEGAVRLAFYRLEELRRRAYEAGLASRFDVAYARGQAVVKPFDDAHKAEHR